MVRGTMTYLRDKWCEANPVNKESTWHTLPETIMEHIEANSIQITDGDLNFIEKVVNEYDIRPWFEIIAVIRLLAQIGERNDNDKERVRPYLIRILNSSKSYIRNAAIEAVWQIGDYKSLPELQKINELENGKQVKSALNHVIPILEKLSANDL